jgi:hypothetical protein
MLSEKENAALKAKLTKMTLEKERVERKLSKTTIAMTASLIAQENIENADTNSIGSGLVL